MNPILTTPAAWSYGIAAIAYAALAVYLAFGWQAGLRGRTMMVAVGMTACWAVVEWAFAVFQTPVLPLVGALLDVLRVGAWYAFLLLAMQRPRDAESPA